MAVNQGIHYNIDRISSFQGDRLEIGISGWCWSPEHRIDGLRLESEIQSVPCLTNLSRPDVAAHFQDQRAAGAGIAGRVRTPFPPASVRLVAEVGGQDREIAAISLPACGPPQIRTSDVRTYADWLALCEPALFSRQGELPGEALAATPLVSVILAVAGSSSAYYLHRSIDSVLSQRHTSWELCICCDAGAPAQLVKSADAHSQADPRIRVQKCDSGSDFAQLFNRAFDASAGAFVLPLRSGDELHREALQELARFLVRHPDTQLLYSDEDEIDDEGHRSKPLFKPAFDEDLLNAFNYIGHPIAIRSDLMRRAGAFQPACGDAYGWDLVLRLSELAAPGSIRHLAKPLYHARHRHRETPPDAGARERVLASRVKRRGDSGAIGARAGGRRIAVLYREDHGTYQLQAIQRTSSPLVTPYELRSDGIRRIGASGSRVKTCDEVEGDVIVMVNAPVEVLNHSFFEAIAECAQRRDCGLAGPLVLGSDGRVVTAGLSHSSKSGVLNPFAGNPFASPGYMGMGKAMRAVAAVTPHCFALAGSRLRDRVPLDEVRGETIPGICRRLAQSAHAEGLKVLFTPHAVAVLTDSAPPMEFGDFQMGPGVPQLNPNLEAFASWAGIFEQEVLP
jgi:glycosyltransferase involved in cell wall biosynthesis